MGTQKGTGRGGGGSGPAQVGMLTDWGVQHLFSSPDPPISFGFRIGIHQLRLVRGPHRIMLSTEELTFVHQPPSRRVGDEGVGWGRWS